MVTVFFLLFSSAVERLKECDEAFRKQLEQERLAYEQRIQTLNSEKQQQLDQANNRVNNNYKPFPSMYPHLQTYSGTGTSPGDKLQILTRK